MDPVTLDTADLGLLHALQVDGRAPFSRIAEVLDISDRTAARRYARLRANGLVRVTGVIDSRRTGDAEWVVRIRVRPGGADAVAQALARRPDAAWVTMLSSGTEIVCVFRTGATEPAPVAALARHREVVDVEAHRLLRNLMTRPWPGRTSALAPDQVAALDPPSGELSGPVTLTELDRRLLPALAVDGRAAYPRLAGALGWSESAVRRRLDELRRAAVLRFDVEVDAVVLGYTFQCVLWLTVAPARLTAVGGELAADPEVAFVGATTGSHNLLVFTVCRDARALFDYVTERVGSLAGVDRVDTADVWRIVKRSSSSPWPGHTPHRP
ncbi:Lrp/AsnC family transcriptional regulator [Nocardia cyriacigeorgica]|uniref:Lrp/AsnC family transcriptional regulator n=1 Tax=Nocardia cyriacigeorgica TaxID=135487 RepID=A0A5R8NA71_9NOCA|nr:Lrp/AsnC family transcriptional regulator [Nocardia cyriacigeorgica]TLF72550.1 Lrp/AsnC family transcriptional regulator [Nocardia cyriacigeorgica]